MKNIWKYLVVAVFAFLLVGCVTKPKEDVYYKVYVEVLEQFVKDQYDLPEFYEVKENEYLELTKIFTLFSFFTACLISVMIKPEITSLETGRDEARRE